MENSKNKILIIGEFPVIHKGYIDFFKKVSKKYRKSKFYFGFLDNKIVSKLTKLEPDLRKIPVAEIKKIINSFLPIEPPFLLNQNNFLKLIKTLNPTKIIILKGDKSRDFANYYLNKSKYHEIIQYYDIRLKWLPKRVVEFRKRNSIIPKREMISHTKFMREAFKEAENSKCWWRQVGAVLIRNGKIILRAFNEMMPSDDECYKIGCIRDEIPPGKLPEICSVAHAEATIIAKAAKKGIRLEDTIMYVTHFPCSACSKLLALSGIKKLVYSRGSSVFDGEKVMRSRGVKIIKI